MCFHFRTPGRAGSIGVAMLGLLVIVDGQIFWCILRVCDAAVCAQEREERKRARDAGGGGGRGGGGGEEEGGRGSRRRTGGGEVLDTGRSRAPEAAAVAKSGNVPHKGVDVPPAKQAPVRNETSVSGPYQPLESLLPLEKLYPDGKTDEQLAKMSCEEVAIWLATPGLNMPQNVLDTVRMGGVNGVQIFDMTLEELTEDLGMNILQAKRLCKNRLPRT